MIYLVDSLVLTLNLLSPKSFNSLFDNDVQNTHFSSVDKIKELEERLLSLESTVSNREYLSKNLQNVDEIFVNF